MSFDQKIYQFDDCNSNRIDIRHPRGCHPIPLSKKVPKQLYELDEDFRPTFPVTFAGSLEVAFVQFHRSTGWVLPVCLPHRSAGWTKRCKMTTSKSRAARWLVRVRKSIVRVSERVLAMLDTLFVWATLCEKRNSQKVTKQGWLWSIEMKKGEHLCRSWHCGRCDGGRAILPKYFFQLLRRNSNCSIVLFQTSCRKQKIFWGWECKVMKQKDILGNGILKSKKVKKKRNIHFYDSTTRKDSYDRMYLKRILT